MGLTSTEITDYNNLNAFAMERTTAKLAGVSSLEPKTIDTQQILRIDSFEESLNFLAGTQSRLEMVRQNITTMQEIVEEANGRNVSLRKQEEYFGNLRSLSAGLDQIVEKTFFNEESFMNGRSVVLVEGSYGNSTETIDFPSLYTFGEDSLGLSEKQASAETVVSYGVATLLYNQSSDLIGLDIASTEASTIASGELELETGDYQIEFLYEGANSTIILRDLDGIEKARKEGVDLSGDGEEIVDMGVGFKIFIDKENPFSDGLDKYDYENLGAASLKADFSYKRNFQHLLSSEEGGVTETKAELQLSVPLYDGENQLKVSGISSTSVSRGFNELETGKYLVEVAYHGSDSRVRLLDAQGGLIGFHFVDLEQTDTYSMDLGVGVQLDIQNLNFSREGGVTTASFNYEKSTQNAKDFNYENFQTLLNEAGDQVDSLITLVEDTLTRFQEDEELREELLGGDASSYSSSLLSGATAVSLLSTQLNANVAGLFGTYTSSAVTQVNANDLFLTTSSMIEAQANLKFSSVEALI